MLMKKRKINLIIGIIAMGVCMIGDWLFDIKGPSSVSHGIVESGWLNMSMWRFEASILIGAAVIPIYYFGIREMMNMFSEISTSSSHTCQKFSKMFNVAAMAGVISFVFIHITCCLIPIIFKCIYAGVPNFKLVTEIVNKLAIYIYVPFFIYYLIADVGISISFIYMVITGKLNVPKWAIICCPLGTIILDLLLKLIPWYPIQAVTVAFETFGYVLMLLSAYVHCRKQEQKIIK